MAMDDHYADWFIGGSSGGSDGATVATMAMNAIDRINARLNPITASMRQDVRNWFRHISVYHDKTTVLVWCVKSIDNHVTLVDKADLFPSDKLIHEITLLKN